MTAARDRGDGPPPYRREWSPEDPSPHSIAETFICLDPNELVLRFTGGLGSCPEVRTVVWMAVQPSKCDVAAQQKTV